MTWSGYSLVRAAEVAAWVRRSAMRAPRRAWPVEAGQGRRRRRAHLRFARKCSPISTAFDRKVFSIMGAAFGGGFTALANELAVAGLGVATLGLVALGLGLMFSVFDRAVMQHFKDALLRIIGGSAIVGGAGVAASFITSNFRL